MVLAKLGYKSQCGSNHNTVLKRLKSYNISTQHFTIISKTERTEENVFCINSTASQCTLREWYKKISKDDSCSICGQSKIWNGKELSMTLDHINGDNHDNRIENLRWICPNCGSQLPTFAGRNNKTRKDENGKIVYIPTSVRKEKKKICPICNINEISVNSKSCIDCYRATKRKDIPSREDLEKLIYTTSFVQIGKMFGKSDNAVRKWCKSYGLPFRYGELHKNIK